MGEIRTHRLRLRAFTPDDVDAYLSYRADPDVLAWLTTASAPTREQAVARIAAMADLGGPTEGQWFNYAIEHDGVVVGDTGAGIRSGGGVAEIGYTLHPGHRGRGYATEAAGALVDHVIEHHGVHRIEASLAPDNVASMRVLESIGMRFEALARLAFDYDGVWEDDLRYAMTTDDRRAWRDRARAEPAQVELVEITARRRVPLGPARDALLRAALRLHDAVDLARRAVPRGVRGSARGAVDARCACRW